MSLQSNRNFIGRVLVAGHPSSAFSPRRQRKLALRKNIIVISDTAARLEALYGGLDGFLSFQVPLPGPIRSPLSPSSTLVPSPSLLPPAYVPGPVLLPSPLASDLIAPSLPGLEFSPSSLPDNIPTPADASGPVMPPSPPLSDLSAPFLPGFEFSPSPLPDDIPTPADVPGPLILPPTLCAPAPGLAPSEQQHQQQRQRQQKMPETEPETETHELAPETQEEQQGESELEFNFEDWLGEVSDLAEEAGIDSELLAALNDELF